MEKDGKLTLYEPLRRIVQMIENAQTHEYDFRLDIVNEKLDNHGTILEAIRKDMNAIAVQSVQIANIQKVQMEHHSDIKTIEDKISLISNWQAGCPRAQIRQLWAVIISIAGTFGVIFLYHIISEKVILK